MKDENTIYVLVEGQFDKKVTLTPLSGSVSRLLGMLLPISLQFQGQFLASLIPIIKIALTLNTSIRKYFVQLSLFGWRMLTIRFEFQGQSLCITLHCHICHYDQPNPHHRHHFNQQELMGMCR